MPIDQIISHIASTNLEKQQAVQTPDSQTGHENTSAEASRRSSTSTQNTDTLTPTNIPSDPTDNQETIISATSADTVMEAHHNIQDDASNSNLKFYQGSTTHAQIQMQQDTAVNTNHANEASKESQELQDVIDVKESETAKDINVSDVAAEVSNLTVPTPVRKVSRFLVSPVVEQKNITAEEETSIINEGTDRTNITTSQTISQSVVNITGAESVSKNEDHVEVNASEVQAVAIPDQINNIETTIQGIQYAAEQTDSSQQVLQQGQQTIGLQNIQVQTLQQVSGHMQQTIGQSKQHTIIMQGAAITSQQTSQQMPQTGIPTFVPVSSQKELQSQTLHTNGMVQQTQYQNQTIVQPGILIQQQQQQQIPISQNVMQPIIQTEHHQHQGQIQAQRPVQQFVPQQVPLSAQQYVMLSGHMQPIQPTNLDDRNRRLPNLTSNVSVEGQVSEPSCITEEKRQTMVAANTPVAHMQHVQVMPQEMSSAMPLSQTTMENVQQPQAAHQNVQHVLGTVPPSVPQVSLPVHPVVATDITTPKIKTKEVSSTLPDLAQNLANILSNPKSKSTTPHPLTSHEPVAAPNVTASTLVEHKPIQSEQYFQPIQPEASQLQVQPPIQHNYQGQIMHQGYQGQQNFQQAFQSQQLLHQCQVQPIPQSIPLTVPQQIDVQSHMVQPILQGVSSQIPAQWIISANQTPLQTVRHIQPNQPQLIQNQPQLQQISVQPQMQQQTMQDQQYNESPIVLDQSHLHLKLPEQHSAKPLEADTLESANLDWYAHLLYIYLMVYI